MGITERLLFVGRTGATKRKREKMDIRKLSSMLLALGGLITRRLPHERKAKASIASWESFHSYNREILSDDPRSVTTGGVKSQNGISF